MRQILRISIILSKGCSIKTFNAIDLLIIPNLILKLYAFYMSYLPYDWQNYVHSSKSDEKERKFE